MATSGSRTLPGRFDDAPALGGHHDGEPTRSLTRLPHHDRSRHHGAVDQAVVLIGAGDVERHPIGVAVAGETGFTPISGAGWNENVGPDDTPAATSGKMSSLEVVEVNPVLDERNATGTLAVELVLSAMGARIL